MRHFRSSRRQRQQFCCGCAAAPSSAAGAAQLLREKRNREGREKFVITCTELWSITNSNLKVFLIFIWKKIIFTDVSGLTYLQNGTLREICVHLCTYIYTYIYTHILFILLYFEIVNIYSEFLLFLYQKHTSLVILLAGDSA